MPGSNGEVTVISGCRHFFRMVEGAHADGWMLPGFCAHEWAYDLFRYSLVNPRSLIYSVR